MTQLLPQNLDAERSVLGSLIIDPRAIARVASILRPDDFFNRRHAQVYQVMLDLDDEGETAQMGLIAERLERQKVEDADTFLGGLANATPTSVFVESYAKQVESAAVRRRIIDAGMNLAKQAYDETIEIDAALETAEQALFQAGQRSTAAEFQSVDDVMATRMVELRTMRDNPNSMAGTPTGFIDLDSSLHGLHPSDLLVLAARPGHGKSALAANIAVNAAKQGYPVAIFSFEMGNDQVIDRFLASSGRIGLERLRHGALDDREWGRVESAASRFKGAPIFLEDTFQQSMTSVRNQARRLAMRKKLGLIIVDYMQLMEGKSNRGQNREQEISSISRGFKLLAKELDVPVLALSQLSRKCEERPNHRPMLSDLRESGSIEQDSDVVMFIYRGRLYNDDDCPEGQADLMIAKHRNGPLATLKLFFDPEQVRFDNLAVGSEVAI